MVDIDRILLYQPINKDTRQTTRNPCWKGILSSGQASLGLVLY